MKLFTDYILEKFSTIENDYSEGYRKYKRNLVEDLKKISSPSFRKDYWKNIQLDFLNQDWEYLRSNSIYDERLAQSYLNELVGENHYINIVFINGFLHSQENQSSILGSLKIEKISGNYDRLLEEKKKIFSFFQRKDLLRNWLLCFNEVLNDEVVTITLPKNKHLKYIVRLIFINDNDNICPLTCPQIFFNIEDGAQLNLIEEHFSMGKALNNHSLKFILGKKSMVRHLLFQNESKASFHINHTYVEQKQDSHYYSYVLQQGAQTSIVQKTIGLIEEKSNCELYGLSYPQDKQAFSNLTTVSHLAPESKSQQFYRGILEDDAFLNFSGIVRVAHEASLTESDQLNQNLLLSKEATALSRPRLEIHNDDVKCSHGATCSDINPQELFYLTSRGIDPDNCKDLLISAFAQNFYDQIQQYFPEWKP